MSTTGKRFAGRAAGHRSGGRATPTYVSWTAMIARCEQPSNGNYMRYGAAGIRVCAEWRASFKAFLLDMGPRPPGHTLGRIRRDQDYRPNNVAWQTPGEQAVSRSSTRWVRIGQERLHVAAWARRLGIPASTIQGRLARGQTPERALGLDRKLPCLVA